MYRKPVHIKADPEKVADRAIVVGDPDRARFIAEKFLNNTETVNTHRGFLLFTGKYGDVKISVACHGVGAPSAAIVFEELVMLGVKTMVRMGTTGALVPELRRGDIVVAKAAGYFDTSPVLELTEKVYVPPVPDLELTLKMYNVLREKLTSRKIVLGNVISNDMFYVENPDLARKLARLGFISIEMECATLFTIGVLRNIRTAAVLLVSNSLVNPDESEIPTSDIINRFYEDVVPVVLDIISKL